MNTFDKWQFDGYRPNSFGKAAAAGGVASNELYSMQQTATTGGRSRRFIPEFANNDAQLRSVLVHATLSYIFHSKKIPDDVQTDLAYLNKMANDRHAYWQSLADGSATTYWNKLSERLRSVESAGGYMALLAAISYRAWRLRWHENEITQEMGLRKYVVHDALLRLNRFAFSLGYPTCKRRSDSRDMDALAEVVASMWKNTAPIGVIAAILSVHPDTVRRLLRKQGLHVWRARTARVLQTNCRKCGTPLVRVSRGKQKSQQACLSCLRSWRRAFQRERRRKASEARLLKTIAWG